MREMSVRDANQNFSQVIAAAEAGETIVITKNGRAVARISPHAADPTSDPDWRARHEALVKSLREMPVTGMRVGDYTRDDMYG